MLVSKRAHNSWIAGGLGRFSSGLGCCSRAGTCIVDWDFQVDDLSEVAPRSQRALIRRLDCLLCTSYYGMVLVLISPL